MPTRGADVSGQEELYPEYESYFAPFAELVLAFVERHGLLLEKYYHDAPMWSLCFRHPAGGEAKLDISTSDGQRLSVTGSWWVDDYDLGTRSIRRTDAIEVPFWTPRLRAVLESCLASVVGWRPGQWDQVAGGYHTTWEPYWTKEQFDELQFRWPDPS
jgi:hypothetical protein